jgi:hypothetical protein
MQAVARFLFGRTLSSRLLFAGLLLLSLAATRWAWIDCDGGVPSLNEYGYFATDEGYYCGGGKMKLLRGRFVSAVRATPCTYAICPSTHVMTWWSFLLFGQTTWAHRFFPMLICSAAWLSVYFFLSRKTLPWIAFLLCSVCVLNPFLIVYGRTACNDTLMGSLLLLGYLVAYGRHPLRAIAGGAILGLGLWVKMSIWVLFPLGAAAAAIAAPRGRRLRQIGLFLAGFATSACIQYGLIRYMIAEDATSQEVTIGHLLEISNSSYPLPNLFDWSLVLRAVSSFPRCPADGLLCVWIAFFLVLPALLLLRRLCESPTRWDGRMILYLTLPLYAGGIILLPVFYAHYYIPVLMFVPLVWFEARRDLKRWAGGVPTAAAALMALAVLAVMLIYNAFRIYPDEAKMLQDYLSNAYNLPPKIVWSHNGGHILSGAAILAALAALARWQKPSPLGAAGLLLSALVVSALCFSSIPLCEAYKYTQIFSATIKDVACLLQVASVVLLFAVWAMPRFFGKGVRWHLLIAAIFACATLGSPVWRNAVRELAQSGHLHKQAAAELAKLLPDNAVVFGERAPQMLLSLKPRVSPAPNADPVPVVFRVHEEHPDWPLFALLDSEHNYHFTHYENSKDKIGMQVLHTFKMPSFNTCRPSDVFLVRLHILKPSEAL